ncbi:MAG: hypothetical protein E3J65_04325 [Dehalococcoidia bacterium]|nr:MAG: hypothetical protein E3J65_04325 [Dehalococcoidia bacterium]
MKAIQFKYSIPLYLATRYLVRPFPNFIALPWTPTQLREVPDPELPGPKWVKIKPMITGVCGSDMGIFACRESLTLAPFASYPFVVGHEVCGEIIELGNEVEGFEMGERVGICGVLGCTARAISPPAACATRDCPFSVRTLLKARSSPACS